MAIVTTSPFWGNSYSFRNGKNPLVRGLLRKLMKKQNMAQQSELIETLNGAAVGGAASVVRTRVAVQSATPIAVGDLGGTRLTESHTVLSRVTATADITAINTLVKHTEEQITFPGDLSGNGK